MMQDNNIKELQWDSDFFSIKIGRIDKFLINEETFDTLMFRFVTSDYKLLYIFDDINNIRPTVNLKNCVLKEVDTKILFEKKLDTIDYENNDEIQGLNYFTLEDEIDLYNLALESGHLSRYKTDKLFKIGEFERFYKMWIKNSLNKSIADDIFIYKENNRIEGFVSLKYSGEYCTIGLIAVSPKLRGKRIGEKLMKKCFSSGKQKGCSTLYVATQLQNQGACRFYQKFDMNINEQKKIYHLWKI